MKKIFLGFAALSLLLGVSSCANETREKAGDSKSQISFKAALGKQSRAEEMDLSGLKDAAAFSTGVPIPVMVYDSADDSQFASWTIAWDGSEWYYNSGTPELQPGRPLTYYSWYPLGYATALNATPTATAASIDYAVFNDPAVQEDLLAAMTSTAFPAVGLAYNHILSQVNFAITGIEYLKVKLENIQVNDVFSQGTYRFSTTNTLGWTGQAVADSYDYTPVGADETNGTTTPDVLYLGNGNGTYSYDNALMLMPQTFATGDGKTFSFDFTLTDAVNAVVLETGSYTIDLGELTAEWAMGKRYVYTVDFTDYIAGGPIRFVVSVTGWENADATNIAQTVYAADATKGSIQIAIGTQNAAKLATPGLTVFPIWISKDLDATTAIVLDDITGANFSNTDEIRLEFPTNASLAFISLDPTMAAAWTLDTTGTGRIAVLKKI